MKGQTKKEINLSILCQFKRMEAKNFDDLMENAPRWLDEFLENRENIPFLKERINLPAWIHISQARLSTLLDQIDSTQNTSETRAAHKNWPKIVRKYSGTERADSIYAIIEYGLRNTEHFETVLRLLIDFISIPFIRLKLEPLIHDTLFMIRCPEGYDSLIDLLQYYLSFHCTISQGTLTWKQVRSNYNKLLMRFQNCLFSNLSPEEQMDEKIINPLVSATENQLNDPVFLHRHLSQLRPEIFESLKDEFGIHPVHVSEEESISLSIAGLSRLLMSPINPIENIPPFLIPFKYPPSDIIIPHLDRYALCLEDAVLQVFQEKRVEVTQRVLHYIDTAIHELKEKQYFENCAPLVAPPSASSGVTSYDPKTIFSIIYDPQYLNYEFKVPNVGDVVYLLNLEQDVYCPFTVIKIMHNFFLGHLESSRLPIDEFDVVLELPPHLSHQVYQLLQLPEILKTPQISSELVDSLIGWASKGDKHPITLVDSPYLSSSSSDAASFLAESFKQSPGQKAVVFGTSSKQLDDFVTAYQTNMERFPGMYFLRTDLLPHERAIEISLDAMKFLLKRVSQIDESFSSSCAVAINQLRAYRSDTIDQNEIQQLIGYLEYLRPLEYLGSTAKRIEYLKKKAPIICHLIGETFEFDHDVQIDQLIILDSCQIEDCALFTLCNTINPKSVRLYGNGPAFQRLWRMPDDVVTKLEIHAFESKNEDIMAFLGYELPPDHNKKLAPGILTPCHIWFENNLQKSLEALVASAFLFHYLRYKKILIVYDECFWNQLELIFLKRTAWNNELRKSLKKSFKTTNEVIECNLKADVVIYFEGIPNNEETRIGDVACASNYVYWVFSTQVLENVNDDRPYSRIRNDNQRIVELVAQLSQENNTSVEIALDENFDDLETIQKKERKGLVLPDINNLLALVFSMLQQVSQSH